MKRTRDMVIGMVTIFGVILIISVIIVKVPRSVDEISVEQYRDMWKILNDDTFYQCGDLIRVQYQDDQTISHREYKRIMKCIK